MIVEIKDKKYMVQFTHVQKGGKVIQRKLSGSPIEETPLERHTRCKILLDQNTEDLGFISIGYARCHPNDNFNKEKGRQFSLNKALDDTSFSKEERTIFWNAYRNWGKKRF